MAWGLSKQQIRDAFGVDYLLSKAREASSQAEQLLAGNNVNIQSNQAGRSENNVMIVNGKRIEVPPGASVSIINDVVTINGVDASEKLSGIVEIRIEGRVGNLRVDRASVTCQNVEGDLDAGGSVSCHAVGGSVDAGGSVQCGDVSGNVDAGGSVSCGKVGGDVDAGGSVIHGR